jgi:uncharacterized membrane protein YeaQ/YmgE (transglycosylase-associated protein family)
VFDGRAFHRPESAPLTGPGRSLRQAQVAAEATRLVYAAGMLILGLILFGMLVGAGAQLIMGKSTKGIDWTLAFVAGLVGSFIGGLLISLLSGDGLQLRPSGIIGSLVGALLVTAGWQWYRRRSKTSQA